MKIIICGAGQVGFNIARYLGSEIADVTIIDRDEKLVNRAMDTLDVRGIVGFASHPNVLEKAGAADADMLIAVTHADEVNMVACQVAHSLFAVPTRIARVRSKTYLDPRWGELFNREHMPIDLIISPEQEVAASISRRLSVPGAFEIIPFVDEKVLLVGVRCTPDTPIVDTPLSQLNQLFPDLPLTMVSVQRGEEHIVPGAQDELKIGDEVHFVVPRSDLERAMGVFGHNETEGRRVLIVGGGNIGQALAELVERDHPGVNAKIIEIDGDQARRAAEQLKGTTVIHGDALESGILEDANIAQTETIVTVTNDDEANILASLLAKRQGAERAIVLVNRADYGPLIGQLGIETVVSPRAITVSSILQHVRHGRIRAAHTVGESIGEVVEIEVMATSAIAGQTLREVKMPKGTVIGGIWRDDAFITPRGGTVLLPGDLAVLFVLPNLVRKVEKRFAVGLEFF